MIGGDFRSVDIPGLPALHFVKFACCGHHGDVNRKIRTGKLSFEDLLQAVRPEILGLEAVKVESILRFEERMEERNTLDVIPMVVSDENMGFDAVVALVRGELIA